MKDSVLAFSLERFDLLLALSVIEANLSKTRSPNRKRLGMALRVLGFILIGLYALLRVYGHVANNVGLQAFSLSTQTAAAAAVEPMPNFTLWDTKRVKAYKESLLKKVTPPMGILRIDKLGLNVSVFEGTSDFILDRGVGHIQDTAGFDGKGNTGIAGHRDGFFRGLKDLVVGDEIELFGRDALYSYKIDQVLIVDPKDVHVLDPGEKPTITLVTCYPFYFIGHAPQRYIVKASLEKTESIKNLSYSKK